MNERVAFTAIKAPRIPIILSHGHLQWPKLIKGIMNTVTLPDNQAGALHFSTEFSTSWHLQNKYYSAYVLLMVLQQNMLSETLSSMKAGNGNELMVEGVIIYWDNKYNDSRRILDTILASLGDVKPEVCLLVCDNFEAEAQVSRYEANLWCIDNGWELIELEPESSDDFGTLDSDFVDYGFQRMQNALHANRWSNMKAVAGGVPVDARRAMINSDEDPFVGYVSLQDGSDEDPEELHNNNDDAESFEELFARFGEMRLTAASLSRDDRLNYAERIATAFLGAMGGDEEEEADTEGENTPDADDGDAVHGYTQLINSLDHVKLDDKSESQVVSPRNETASSEDLSKDEFTREISSAELLKELGFPVVYPDTSDEASNDSNHKSTSQEADAQEVDESCIADAQDDELPQRSYEDIENELKQEDLAARLRRAAATEEIHKELHENLEHSKRFRM